MKRIGIITFHRAINYGAVLQTVGLYQTLKNMKKSSGIEIEIIDYRNAFIEKMYSPFYSYNDSLIKSLVKVPLYFGLKFSKKRKFMDFIKENVILSKKYTQMNINDAETEYDIIITGSDQVWNDRCAEFDAVYFLNFVKESFKKNSYAASLGMKKIPQELEKEYKERLQDFNNLSVREESANVKLTQLLERKDIQTVLDPTLICDEMMWKKMASELFAQEKYILLYMVNSPIELLEFAKKLSQKTGYPIYFISDKLFSRHKALNYLSNVSPQEFLGLIKNAEYVVTNSFHGTAFSIIFEKNFYVELNTNMGINNRAKELLELTDLLERDIQYYEEIGISKIINWNEVKRKLEIERKSSLDYLKQMIDK